MSKSRQKMEILNMSKRKLRNDEYRRFLCQYYSICNNEEIDILEEIAEYSLPIIDESVNNSKSGRFPRKLSVSSLKKRFNTSEYHNVIDKLSKSSNVKNKKFHLFFYSLINGLTYCKYCESNIAIFKNFKDGFLDYCNSPECYQKEAKRVIQEKYGTDNPSKSELIKQKIKQTFLNKYGVEHPSKLDKVKEKIRQTVKTKYGVDNVSQLDSVKQKRKQTILVRYGVENYSQTPEWKHKVIHTNRLKYGKDFYAQTQEYKEKVKETCRQKYGVDYYFQSNEFKYKFVQVMQSKYQVNNPMHSQEIKSKLRKCYRDQYGTEWVTQSQVFKEKSKQTMLNKYGVDHYSKTEEFKERISKYHRSKASIYQWHTNSHIKNKDKLTKEYIEKHFVIDGVLDINSMCQFYNLGKSALYKKVNELNVSYAKYIPKSKAKIEIANYIEKELGLVVETNVRNIIKPYELDIYIPEKKIAIEFNGLMYHSYGYSDFEIFNKLEIDKYYHLRKTELCEQQGIQLLHIFENEWSFDDTKKEIWKSVIKSKLHLNDNRIYARECEIVELDSKQTKTFLSENHLQGHIPSSYNIGLIHKDQLVTVMTFGKLRFTKENIIELYRFASLKNTLIVGGFSKLLNYAIRKYNLTKIVSYANRRWSNGNVYKVNGFKLIGKTEPNYYYFKPNDYHLYNRIHFQKHKLKDLLPVFDDNKSELENMLINGYRIIFDSGNLKFLFSS